MANPNEDVIQGQGNRVFWMLQNLDLMLRHDSENFEGHYDDLVADAAGDFASLMVAGADQLRALASGLVDWRNARNMMDAVLLNYGKQQGFPESDPLSILDRLFVYFAEGSERVLTRTFTFGSITSVTGTGDGTIHRLTTDRYGFTIENCTPETKNFRCIADKFSGTQLHQERFEIRGEERPRDFVGGHVSGDRIGALSCISADDSLQFLDNPSFNTFTGTGASITAIQGWTVTNDIANFEEITSDSYRTAVHEGSTPKCVRITANDKLVQDLTTIRPTLARRVPYFLQIAYKPESSADGTLTLRLGATSKAVAVSGTTWQILKLDLDEGLFYRNFNATTLDVEIEWSGRSAGTILLDDIVFAPMTQFDGLFHAGVGGETPFLVDREYTFADSVASTGGVEDAINQKWVNRLYGRYFPHDTTASGNVTWVEAS